MRVSMAIVHGAQVVHTLNLGVADRASERPATVHTHYRVGSLTKPVTAALTIALVDDGLLSLDEPITRWLEHASILPNPTWAGEFEPGPVTLRHLLTHYSGLPRNPPNVRAIGRDPFGGYSDSALDMALAELVLDWPPGIYVNYSNFGFAVLGRVLEAVTKESFESLLTRRLLDPLGIHEASLAPPQPETATIGYRISDIELVEEDWDLGALAPAGGLYASACALARFLTLLLDPEVSAGLGISADRITEMLSPHVRLQNHEMSIALGWFHHRIEDVDIYWHTGWALRLPCGDSGGPYRRGRPDQPPAGLRSPRWLAGPPGGGYLLKSAYKGVRPALADPRHIQP
jgi:serine-type D-Ala-D-Ala carboxypeptidase/endopeptidase